MSIEEKKLQLEAMRQSQAKLQAELQADIEAEIELERQIQDEQDACLECEEEEESFWERNKVWATKNMAAVQGISLIAFFCFVLYMFNFYEHKINTANAKLTAEQLIGEKINPYNDANIQRIWFEKTLQVPDLLVAFVFILIAFPSVFFYAINLLKTKKDFGSEFMNEITPFQRIIVVVVLFASLLIYSGLTHSVNSF